MNILHDKWPRDRRAAEQRDELAPFQLVDLHSVPVSQGRIAGYRIGEDQSAGNDNLLVAGEGGPCPSLPHDRQHQARAMPACATGSFNASGCDARVRALSVLPCYRWQRRISSMAVVA